MKRLLLSILTVMTSLICFAQYTQMTNIPTIYIKTYDNKPIQSKTAYIYATMTYVDGSNVVTYDSLQIRGRGNSTWGLAKKPYRIKFKSSTKFLGKGYAKNKSWTLLANHADKSLLRNAVTFNLGEFLGQPFNPASHFVDLVLNGTYLGNYQVSDQINVDNKRVEIVEQESAATETSNITGGYLVEIDGFGSEEKVHFVTNKNLIVSIKSPDEDVINTAQRNYIRNYLNDFESKLFGASFADAEQGYRAVVDSATLVSWYIATELSANPDGFWSTYLYKDKDDPKLYFGPLWDYDIAYNNCNRVGDVTSRDMIEAGFGSDLTKVWMKRMIQDPWFNNAVNEAWKQKLNEGLHDYLHHYIDSMAAYIDRSQQKNYTRYAIKSRVYNEIYLYSTYAEYIDQLKRFITQHMDFLTTRFAQRAKDYEERPVVLKPFALKDNYYYRIFNKGTNKVLDIANQSNDADANVVIWSPISGRDTQLWQIVKVGDCYQLINKATGMAFNDPSPDSATLGTVLTVTHPNNTDNRQLWKFVTVNENDNYNIINAFSDHAINNSGGGASDGNYILSYTNDDRNSLSNNRQWRITAEEPIPDYIPEEVKTTLATTIAEAETFLNSLNASQIGNGIFCYPKEQVERLQQMINDAKTFESTVTEDYILTNVNLSKQFELTQVQILPEKNKLFVIHHKSSGYYLDVANDKLSITSLDNANEGQQYTFESMGVGNSVYLKSRNGLYVTLGPDNHWTMIGQEGITNELNAMLNVTVADGHYYINTVSGLLGTDDVTDHSIVYADKDKNNPDAVRRSEWMLEEYIDEELNMLKEQLALLLTQATEATTKVRRPWLGNNPMRHNKERLDALTATMAEAETYTNEPADAYQDMILRLADALTEFNRLNAPDEDADYYLQHASGLNLSCSDGLILAEADTTDATQRFRLVPVPNAINTYNIYVGGMYVTMMEDGTLALSETPHDKWGQFVAEQVASTSFTLTGAAGLLGTDSDQNEAGTPCIGNAPDIATNVRWQLEKATGILADAMDPQRFRTDIDYTVLYDKQDETIRFVSDDMLVLAVVDVQIYTVGGLLLYTFKANEQQSLANLPGGTYIVRWMLGNRSRSIKFKK